MILPAIAYLWIGGEYSTTQSVVYTIILALTGMADDVLKPLLLGRAPMPVVLIGALAAWRPAAFSACSSAPPCSR